MGMATLPTRNTATGILGAVRYIWADIYGRIAIMVALIGTIGLTTHYWSALPLVAVIPRAIRQSARHQRAQAR